MYTQRAPAVSRLAARLDRRGEFGYYVVSPLCIHAHVAEFRILILPIFQNISIQRAALRRYNRDKSFIYPLHEMLYQCTVYTLPDWFNAVTTDKPE